jgi:PilZ domain
MNSSERMDPTGQQPERRTEPRSTRLPSHRVEIKFPSVPVYQLKVRDVSSGGAGIIVRADSKFLTMVQVGQELSVNFLAPADVATLSGHHQLRVEHITELEKGRFKGHLVVGISILR